MDSIAEQYLGVIKEETYQENFRKHEEMIAGVSNTDLDMEELFSEAEKLLEDDDADSTNNP